MATPDDPATARLGESVYAFWGRSIAGGWRSAWALEAARLAALGLPLLHWRNQMLWFAALPPAFAAALDTFEEAAPGLKERVVRAAAACVAADRAVTATEYELLRTVCSALDCPFPPVGPPAA